MNEDLARRRFMVLSLIRLSGVGMVLFGLLVIADKVELPAAAGFVIFAVGMIDTMIVPLLLARRWKSPPP